MTKKYTLKLSSNRPLAETRKFSKLTYYPNSFTEIAQVPDRIYTPPIFKDEKVRGEIPRKGEILEEILILETPKLKTKEGYSTSSSSSGKGVYENKREEICKFVVKEITHKLYENNKKELLTEVIVRAIEDFGAFTSDHFAPENFKNK